MPIVDLLHHHDNLRPLVSRCADVNAIDLLLSACCESSPPETISPFVEFQQATNMRLLCAFFHRSSLIRTWMPLHIGRIKITRKLCYNGGIYAVDDTANFFKCSINTCKLTSSVRTGAPLS
ncbi:hypothetical protein ALC53_01793 [Atta colombica]|uniref:Uncharacterized protein n=1 Tax=Atta colombica TaxID=520822 RepID=A0A151I5K7_9HYME|nr:hypothetical protein ALC53_01793 [Atta colombica]